MKVQDFEKAIVALNCSIVLDEVKLQEGQVRQFNGHKEGLQIVWDESGRAFTCTDDQESEEFIAEGSGKSVIGRRLKRDSEFDLKFE